MSEIRKVIDEKFDIAIAMSMSGKDSIGAGKDDSGGTLEIIGLDSFRGPDSRCLITRNGLDSKPPTIQRTGNKQDLSVYSFGVEIPREKGDYRKFEDLPFNAIKLHPFMIDVDHAVLIPSNANSLRKDWRNLHNLCGILSVMRVVEKVPEIYVH